MEYAKNKENHLFYEPSEKVIAKHSLIEITKKEFDEILAEQQKPTPEQLKEVRIAELEKLLLESDFKVLPDYDQPNEGIKAQRQAWREEIRQLKKG